VVGVSIRVRMRPKRRRAPKRPVMVAEPSSLSGGEFPLPERLRAKATHAATIRPSMDARSATSRPARPRVAVGPNAAVPILALIAALLLALAELSTIASVDVRGSSCEVLNDSSPELADRCELSGWERHGGALILLALVAAGAGAAARSGRSRAGAAAAGDGLHAAAGAVLVAVGAVVLALTLIGDLPETNETGAIGFDFEGATGSAGLGFYLELIGGVLCLIAGILALGPALRARSGAAGPPGVSDRSGESRTSGAQLAQRKARRDLNRAAHDERDAGDQRERLEPDIGVRHDDDAGGDPDNPEQR
jgi:hypothetical protein